jgi:hypothetical protein
VSHSKSELYQYILESSTIEIHHRTQYTIKVKSYESCIQSYLALGPASQTSQKTSGKFLKVLAEFRRQSQRNLAVVTRTPPSVSRVRNTTYPHIYKISFFARAAAARVLRDLMISVWWVDRHPDVSFFCLEKTFSREQHHRLRGKSPDILKVKDDPFNLMG